jgi:hypothetical protein
MQYVNFTTGEQSHQASFFLKVNAKKASGNAITEGYIQEENQ